MGYSGDESCIAEGAEGGKFEFGVVQTLTGHHTLDVWIAEDSGVATSATSAPKIGDYNQSITNCLEVPQARVQCGDAIKTT